MWLVFTLLLLSLTSILGILFRRRALASQDPRSFSFLLNLCGLIITVVVIAVSGVGQITLTLKQTLLLIVSAIGYGAFQRFQFSVRKHIEASKIQIVLAPTGIAGFCLAIVWLKEDLTWMKLIGYLLIIFGSILITYRQSVENPKLNKYVALAFFIGCILSISATLSKNVVSSFEKPTTYILIIWLSQTIACYLPRLKLSRLKKEIEIHKLFIPSLALVNVLATICFFTALKLAPITKVSPIESTNVIVIGIAGILYLKEKDHIPRKLFSALLTVIGLAMVAR